MSSPWSVVCPVQSEVELVPDPGNLTPFPVSFLYILPHSRVCILYMYVSSSVMAYSLSGGRSKDKWRCDTISSKIMCRQVLNHAV